MNELHDNDVSLLEWPAQYADLNLIEHAWDLLERRAFSEMPENMRIEKDLFLHLCRFWSLIPQNTID